MTRLPCDSHVAQRTPATSAKRNWLFVRRDFDEVGSATAEWIEKTRDVSGIVGAL
jgi:hypothetical protein